jgi:RNA polymerase sigma factor (sigma-70 family)
MNGQLTHHLAQSLMEDRLRRARPPARRVRPSGGPAPYGPAPAPRCAALGHRARRMSTVLHHDKAFIESLQSDRMRAAARRRPPADPGDLERTVIAAADGDDAAWASLCHQFTQRLRALARRYRLGPHDVDDAVQSTWEMLVQHIGRLRQPAALGAWLDTTAKRESLRILAGVEHEPLSDEELLPEERSWEGLDHRLIAAAREPALAHALQQLAGRDRALLAMLFADAEPSYAEISAALDVPIGSIGPTRGRLLARLQRDRKLATAIES